MSAEAHVLSPPTNIMNCFADALHEAVPSDRAHLAFDLFSQTSRAQGADAVLLTLVSAIEALVVPAKVSNSEQEFVALLAQQVEKSDVVQDPDRRAALANDRVYELRSRLSHGDAPSWRDVGDVGSELGRFTRDLIDLEFTSPDSADRI